MRARSFFFVAALQLTSALALGLEVAVPAAPDLAGKGSGIALTHTVREALGLANVGVAKDVQINKAAKAAKVKPKALTAAHAAKLAAKGKFDGVIIYRKGKAGVFAQLIDPRGQVLLERLVHVKKKKIQTDDVSALASAVSEALGGAAPAPAAAPQAPLQPAPTPEQAPPPPAPEQTPAPQAQADSDAPAGGPQPEAAKSSSAGASSSSEASSDPVFRGGVFFAEATRLFLAPGFSYVTTSPFPEFGAEVEIFPFSGFGLGLMGDFAIGIVSDSLAGGTGSFSSTALRFDIDLAYRLRLFAGPLGTLIYPQLGLGMMNFDAGSATQPIAGDDRLFPEVGVKITQPIVASYLRASVDFFVLPFSNQGNAGQTAYGPSSALGLAWGVEVGGDLIAGLEWALAVNQERFMDSYTGDSGVDVETMYGLHLRYHL